MSLVRNILVVHSHTDVIGPHQVLYRIVRRLHGERFHFLVVAPADGVAVEQFRALGVDVEIISQVRALKRTWNPIHWMSFFVLLIIGSVKLCHYIHSHRIDLVHTTDSLCWTGGIAARLAGVPSVQHVHGLRQVSPRPLGWVVASVLTLISDFILFVSDATLNAMPLPPGARRKAIVVYNGVDTNEFSPRPFERENLRSDLGVAPHETVVATIGTLEERKGQEYFVRACPKVRQSYPDVRFLVVGRIAHSRQRNGYDMRVKRLAEELGVGENIVFAGEHHKIANLLNAVDLVVQPSLTEAGPLVPLEAMACGIPVIATDVGGNPEEVEDGITGLLVPPGDADALAEAIVRLLRDKARRQRMGVAGRRRVEEQFSLHTQSELVAAIYDDLTSVRGQANRSISKTSVC